MTNEIISMILSTFELDAKLVSKIKAYQSKDGLQNEKGLEKYIDKILTEKRRKEWGYLIFLKRKKLLKKKQRKNLKLQNKKKTLKTPPGDPPKTHLKKP